MRLLNVHLLKIGVAKMKSKVIKTRQLKIIFWRIKPLALQSMPVALLSLHLLLSPSFTFVLLAACGRI